MSMIFDVIANADSISDTNGAATGDGIDALLQYATPGKTVALLGSSGVGKSTIINRLLGRETLRTQGVSATGEGRHTTVRRELILLEGGALVIDNWGDHGMVVRPSAEISLEACTSHDIVVEFGVSARSDAETSTVTCVSPVKPPSGSQTIA